MVILKLIMQYLSSIWSRNCWSYEYFVSDSGTLPSFFKELSKPIFDFLFFIHFLGWFIQNWAYETKTLSDVRYMIGNVMIFLEIS